MKKFLLSLFIKLVSCYRCHGLGTIEINGDDTKECHICGGKGYLK